MLRQYVYVSTIVLIEVNLLCMNVRSPTAWTQPHAWYTLILPRGRPGRPALELFTVLCRSTVPPHRGSGRTQRVRFYSCRRRALEPPSCAFCSCSRRVKKRADISFLCRNSFTFETFVYRRVRISEKSYPSVHECFKRKRIPEISK